MTAPQKPLTTSQSLNIRARRIMLIAGLGVFAAVFGAVITGELNFRLQPKLIGAPRLVSMLVGGAVWRLWVLAALPLIGFGVGRALRLRPVSFAFGAAISGELFYLAIDFATSAMATVTANLGFTALRVFTLALGILLTMRATRAGIRSADAAQERATQVAQSKKDEYAEMLREAERTAERHAAAHAGTASSAPPADSLTSASPVSSADPASGLATDADPAKRSSDG